LARTLLTVNTIGARMLRHCPLCAHESLRPLRVSTTVVGTCARCHGLWFERGSLERFADRPSARVFREAARRAPSRCRRLHLVPMTRAECATCQGAPVSCPGCGSRLARVVTSACPVDVCPRCEGIWLDAGGFERLDGVTNPQVWPAGAVAATSGPRCMACGVGLQGGEVFAYQGDLYCARCGPPGAVKR
jgi:Zn-finger nucleic acid-binding protein